MASGEGERSVATGFKRGFQRLCPNCGEAKLFSGYLKVEPTCAACGHQNSVYRADDGPAYFTILLVGHLVIGPLLFLSFVWTWPPFLTAALLLPLLALVTLTVLPFIKGALIGFMWSRNISEPS